MRAEVAVRAVHACLANLVTAARADRSRLTCKKSRIFSSVGALRFATSSTAARSTRTISSCSRSISAGVNDRHDVFGCSCSGPQHLVGVRVAERVDRVLVHEEHAHLIAALADRRARNASFVNARARGSAAPGAAARGSFLSRRARRGRPCPSACRRGSAARRRRTRAESRALPRHALAEGWPRCESDPRASD